MSVEDKKEELDLHPEVQKQLEKIPSFLEIILVMPQNPAAITEKINRYRSLKAQKDDKKMQSLHEYYTSVV
jgi:hypothetical protein